MTELVARGNHTESPDEYGAETARRRTRAAALIAVVGLTAGIAAASLPLTSGHEDNAAATAVLVLLTGWSFIAGGLFAWLRRPDNSVGKLMIAVGFVSFLGALGDSNTSWLFTLGVALGNASLALFAHLLLAFPTGRLETRARRTVALLLYIDLIGLQLLWLLFADLRETGCRDCVAGGIHEPVQLAENALLTWPNASVADAIEQLQNVFGIALGAAVAVMLVQRWRTATPPARRALAPVLLTGAVALVLLLVALGSYVVWQDASPQVRWIALVGYTLVPFAFVAGILRGRLARSAVGSLVIELGGTAAPGELRDSLARALGDPSLELAYHVGEGQLVDVHGHPYRLPGPDAGRMVTTVEHEGRPVAVLVHDPTLEDDQELVDAVTAATALALENERLQAELRARLDELERERDFLSTVANVTPSLLVVADPEGRIVSANRAFEEASGLAVNRGITGTLMDVFHDAADAEIARLTLMNGARRPRELESEWRGRDGGRMLVAWSSTPITDAEGRPRALVHGVDITHRKRQEEELRSSRARLVEAGDAERRRLERNLHDGAQQRLVSLALTLRLAEARLRTDPDAAGNLVRQAAGDLSDALAELRELARGIHPAVLTERGLGAALAAIAERAAVDVEIVELPDERLPEPVEVATYYLVAESLTNVGRYAQATQATVRVQCVDSTAVVEVSDDGVGGADPTSGSGLRGLRDRVEALGGALIVTSPEGEGTTIRAEIPRGETL